MIVIVALSLSTFPLLSLFPFLLSYQRFCLGNLPRPLNLCFPKTSFSWSPSSPLLFHIPLSLSLRHYQRAKDNFQREREKMRQSGRVNARLQVIVNFRFSTSSSLLRLDILVCNLRFNQIFSFLIFTKLIFGNLAFIFPFFCCLCTSLLLSLVNFDCFNRFSKITLVLMR